MKRTTTYLSLACACLITSIELYAADQIVANTNDSGVGSLRQAITDVGTGETITFNVSLDGLTITLGGTQLEISKSLTIDASALTSGLTIDANNASRIFLVNTGNTVILNSLTLTNGQATAGGAISNSGELTINDSTLTDNESTQTDGNGGGAIFSNDTLTINNCILSSNNSANNGGAISNLGTLNINIATISDNDANDNGGGLYNAIGTVNIDNVTISGNTTDYGGGISNSGIIFLNNSTLSNNSADIYSGGVDNFEGSLNSSNSTFSANHADLDGGAINNYTGAVTLINNTISGNTSFRNGGGVYSEDSTLTLINTIVGNNSASTSGPDVWSSATPATTGVNLISNLSDSGLSVGPTVALASPLLAPLGDYGGSTQTMPPLPGSPSIEGAVLFPATPTTDQQGSARPFGLLPDIGAVEAFALADVTLVDSADSDGIDDRVEEGIFGDTTTANATSDTDGDGSLDIDEIANMTNPLDPNDYFRILSFAPASGFDPTTNPVFDVTIKTFPGFDYEFECNQNLDFSGTPDTIEIPETGGFTETFEVELAAGKDFIRAVKK